MIIPIEVTLDGITKDVNDVHPLNAFVPSNTK
jgi:hypothetical protein